MSGRYAAVTSLTVRREPACVTEIVVSDGLDDVLEVVEVLVDPAVHPDL